MFGTSSWDISRGEASKSMSPSTLAGLPRPKGTMAKGSSVDTSAAQALDLKSHMCISRLVASCLILEPIPTTQLWTI
jgi:hypothetical protein